MVSLYNRLTSSDGKLYAAKGWKKPGITGVINGESALPP